MDIIYKDLLTVANLFVQLYTIKMMTYRRRSKNGKIYPLKNTGCGCIARWKLVFERLAHVIRSNLYPVEPRPWTWPECQRPPLVQPSEGARPQV